MALNFKAIKNRTLTNHEKIYNFLKLKKLQHGTFKEY